MNWWNLVEMYKSFSYFSIFFKKSLDYNTTRCVPLNSLFISSSKFICVIIIELTKLNKNEFPLTLNPNLMKLVLAVVFYLNTSLNSSI